MQARNKYLERLKDCNRHKEPGLRLIMGSIGHYGAMLHDGSEYTASYTEKLIVDDVAVETILCQMEAEAVTEMLLKDYLDVKFWVSFQCKDELRLAHGENFANAAKSVWELIRKANAVGRLYCIDVNCVNPKVL
uniref:Hcy-binding domain-containing protein n=1 Tax=Glossina palpalis gambiensis TaxID=67801 RepID=A0A1B0C5Q4_9MUSC